MCRQCSWQQRSIWGRRAGKASQQPRGEGSMRIHVISCPRGDGEKFYRTSTRLGSREEFRSELRGSKQPTSYHSSPFISWQRWSIDLLSAGTKTELARDGHSGCCCTCPPPLGLPRHGTQWDCRQPAPASPCPGLSLPHFSL